MRNFIVLSSFVSFRLGECDSVPIFKSQGDTALPPCVGAAGEGSEEADANALLQVRAVAEALEFPSMEEFKSMTNVEFSHWEDEIKKWKGILQFRGTCAPGPGWQEGAVNTSVAFSEIPSEVGTAKATHAQIHRDSNSFCASTCGPYMVNLTCRNQFSGLTPCGACRADTLEYELVRVPSFDVTKFSYPIAYAKNNVVPWEPNSHIPDGLKGIWWMDQFGHSNTTRCDPNFKYFQPLKTTEILVSWGETASYDEETRCVVNKMSYGGPSGTSAWMDASGKKTNPFWKELYDHHTVMEYCQTSESPLTYSIGILIKGPALLLKFLGFKDRGDGYYQVPEYFFSMEMIKTCFGYDYKTTVKSPIKMPPTILALLKQILPKPLYDLLELTDHPVQHYPLIPIVDMSGLPNFTNAFEFEKFLATARIEGLSKGPIETMLVGRPMPST